MGFERFPNLPVIQGRLNINPCSYRYFIEIDAKGYPFMPKLTILHVSKSIL